MRVIKLNQNRLATPDAEFAQRQHLLDGVIPPDADLPVRNLLYTLLQRGDLSLLPHIAAALRERAGQAYHTQELPDVDIDPALLAALLGIREGSR